MRMIPTGTFSVATAEPAAEEPVPVAMFVEAGSRIRRIRSLRIVEATLFNVTTEGRDMIRILPSLSAASNELARSRNSPDGILDNRNATTQPNWSVREQRRKRSIGLRCPGCAADGCPARGAEPEPETQGAREGRRRFDQIRLDQDLRCTSIKLCYQSADVIN